jgi:hypothetical protein
MLVLAGVRKTTLSDIMYQAGKMLTIDNPTRSVVSEIPQPWYWHTKALDDSQSA